VKNFSYTLDFCERVKRRNLGVLEELHIRIKDTHSPQHQLYLQNYIKVINRNSNRTQA
jgi:hypothetical protein